MGQALGTVLPLAVAVAIFPVPVIAAVLLVGSDGGRAKGAAFALAWVAGLGTLGVAVLAFAHRADASEDGEPATWVSVVLLALGLLAWAAAAKQWRGRPRAGEVAATPGWMRTVDDFSLARAAGAGFALTALNPKNVLLTAAAAVEIAELGLPAGRQLAALAVFVLVASLGVLAPLALTVALGARAQGVLDGLRAWMARHNAALMTVLLLLIGAKLVGDAVTGFFG